MDINVNISYGFIVSCDTQWKDRDLKKERAA